nr:MAG TPA: hypothetical protein [Caudoviricetes sp.]
MQCSYLPVRRDQLPTLKRAGLSINSRCLVCGLNCAMFILFPVYLLLLLYHLRYNRGRSLW